MNRLLPIKRGLPLLAVLLLAGCMGRSSGPGASRPGAAPAAGPCDTPVSVHAPVAPVKAAVDSIVCFEGCDEYTCYFAAGSLDRAALDNIRRIIFESPLFNVSLEACADTQEADCLRARALDSLAGLAWLGGEPWERMRALFGAWVGQQLERDYTLCHARRDPDWLYTCTERDSVVTRCADILTHGGSRFVGEVRCLLREAERAKAAADSLYYRSYLAYALTQLEQELSAPDSVRNARERLFQLLSNHLNHKIHARLGEDGTVDFNRFGADFLRLFDSVKVESWEP